MALREDLLAILACPRCKEPVEPSPKQDWLICAHCQVRFPVKGDLPIMLWDEASPLEE